MRRAVVGLVCAASAAALPAPALAQAPTNGQLAVVLKDRIVAVNADGSAQRSLYAPGSGEEITHPAWSPDGNKLAFSYQRKITVLDFSTGSRTSLTQPGADGQDVEPTWSTDGTRIGFRRIRGQVHQRLNMTLDGVVRAQSTLGFAPDALAVAPNLTTFAYRLDDTLLVSTTPLEVELGVTGTPAWSSDGTKLAYNHATGLRVATNPGFGGATITPIAPVSALAPRWAPAGDALAFLRDGAVFTVAARQDATPVPVPGITGATAVDWQPCSAATTVGCESVLPPVCDPATAQVTTQADQPVELPTGLCKDPGGRPLSLLVGTPPQHGSISGTTYTPGPGFVGQDSVTVRFSNGRAQSDPVRVTVFVVPRPAPLGPPPTIHPAPTAAAPYLSLRVRPKLDRKRRIVARVSCDQACSFRVRLDGKLRKKKHKRVKGRSVKRTLAPGRVLALRLKLPAKPKGALKTVYITGTVRGANGASRPVKLPVTVRRR